MNTLQEIAAFVGQNKTSFRDMTNLVPLLTPAGRVSMQQMIRELQTLPPITLDASISSTRGTVPFQPSIHISATTGAVSSTIVYLYLGASMIHDYVVASPAAATNADSIAIGDNGAYVFEVVRMGVQSTGAVTLTKSFNVTALAAPGPPPPRPPQLVHPQLSATANGDGSFTLTGKLFSPRQPIHIRVVDDVHANDQVLQANADVAGMLPSYKTPVLCVFHGTIYFSANDGRPDPGDITGTLWSNTVPMSC